MCHWAATQPSLLDSLGTAWLFHVVGGYTCLVVLLLRVLQTHETIAVAVNRIGGKSNSGEGGEDPIRWTTLSDADGAGERLASLSCVTVCQPVLEMLLSIVLDGSCQLFWLLSVATLIRNSCCLAQRGESLTCTCAGNSAYCLILYSACGLQSTAEHVPASVANLQLTSAHDNCDYG